MKPRKIKFPGLRLQEIKLKIQTKMMTSVAALCCIWTSAEIKYIAEIALHLKQNKKPSSNRNQISDSQRSFRGHRVYREVS